MRMTILRGLSPLFNAAGDGGGGLPAAAAAAAAPAPAQPAAGGAPSGLPAGGAAPAPEGAQAPAPGQATADYWPEGLDASLKGADAKTTLDNIAKQYGDTAKALKGFRDAQATRGVPEKPEGYTDFASAHMQGFKIDPAFQTHFDNLKADPVFSDMMAVAHGRGIGQRDFAEIYQAGLQSMAKAGMLEPPLDEEAEKRELVPPEARSLPKPDQEAAVERRIRDNLAFLDNAVTNMGLPADLAKHLEISLADSAKGHQALEWFKGRLQGGGVQPGNVGLPGGGDTKESIRAEQAKVDAMALGSPERQTAEAALDERRRRMTPN